MHVLAGAHNRTPGSDGSDCSDGDGGDDSNDSGGDCGYCDGINDYVGCDTAIAV